MTILNVYDPVLGGLRNLNVPDLVSGGVASNMRNRVRECFETWPNDALWEDPVLGFGDFIVKRGNTAGTGWLEISKSPFESDSETVLTMRPQFTPPLRLLAQVSLTHRNAGEQIFSQEFVSDDEASGKQPLPAPQPVAIVSASQSGTTITVNFQAQEQPFRVGQVVSIYGFVDTRLNVNSCTVASTPTPAQITVVGNDYTLVSTTIAETPGNGAAFVERVDMLGNARNGAVIVHGHGSTTQRRYYFRANGALARPSGPSGAITGTHNISAATDASSALAGSAPYSESWNVAVEQGLQLSREGITVADRAPDLASHLTSRFRSSQVTPDPELPYKLRFRVRNTPSLTKPLAKIVSITKSGSTVATVHTDGPHNLTTGQYVGFNGVRDRVNFPPAYGVQCTVVDSDTFTVSTGASVTATSFGGYVMRMQGQQPLGGMVDQSFASVSRAGGVLVFVGNGSWSSLAVGNLCEVYGVRADSTGEDLGLDGTYSVVSLVGSQLILSPVAGRAPTGADFASVNCGGAVIVRFGVRIHGITAVDHAPMMVEPAAKGLVNDTSETSSVLVWSMPGLRGEQADNSASTPNPVLTSVLGMATNPATGTSGRQRSALGTLIGAQVVKPYTIPGAAWDASLVATSTAADLIAAAGSGLRRYVTAIQVTNTGTADADLTILDGTVVRWVMPLPPKVPTSFEFPVEFLTTANTAIRVSATGTVRINAQGYTAP